MLNKGKVDKLTGLKENVIVGRLVSAGSIKNTWTESNRGRSKILSELETRTLY